MFTNRKKTDAEQKLESTVIRITKVADRAVVDLKNGYDIPNELLVDLLNTQSEIMKLLLKAFLDEGDR